MLPDAGANPNDGSLHKAVRNNRLDIARLLLDHSAQLRPQVDSVNWPLEIGDYWSPNPDINRLRIPRDDVLCFAISWPGSRLGAGIVERERYASLIAMLLNAYEFMHLPVKQAAVQAALDANNAIRLQALLDFKFSLRHDALDLYHYQAPQYSFEPERLFISYFWSSTGSLGDAVLYLFSPVEYTMMMHCDDYVIQSLVYKEFLYSTEFNSTDYTGE